MRAQQIVGLRLISEEQFAARKYKAESEQWDIQRVTELLNTAQEEERSLELELEKTRITAPFRRVVARRYVRDGQAVSKGDRLFWVTAEGPLRLRFTLPENFWAILKTGQELAVDLARCPQEQHPPESSKSVRSLILPAARSRSWRTSWRARKSCGRA